MQTRKPEDAVFDACATGTVIAAGTAYAALLYLLFTTAATLLESFIRSADVTLRSF